MTEDKPIRPEVLLDCDGVIADFDTAYWKLADSFTKGGLKFDRESCPAYSWRDHIEGEVFDKCEKVAREPGFCARILPYDGALEAVQRLREFANVHVVTSPLDSIYWVHERSQWLEAFGFERDDITFTRAKHRVHGDVLIEDWPGHLVKWSAGKPNTHSYLVDRRYNRTFQKSEIDPRSNFKRGAFESLVESVIEEVRRPDLCVTCKR